MEVAGRFVYEVGGACSGKDTLGVALKERLGWPVVSIGQTMRDLQETRGQFKEINSGGMANSAVAIKLMSQIFDGLREKHSVFLSTGSPRLLREAKALYKMGSIRPGDIIVQLQVSFGVVIGRLRKRRRENWPNLRADDKWLAFFKRWLYYHLFTKRVIRWFEKNGLHKIIIRTDNTAKNLDAAVDSIQKLASLREEGLPILTSPVAYSISS